MTRAWNSGVAVVVPCFKVTKHVLSLLATIGPEVDVIYCVDDACPDGSGDLIERECRDPRVRVLRNEQNQGVGGAVVTGYRQAIADGATVMVKLDGDGQMNPALISRFVAPILAGQADYTKGNRFWDLTHISRMPLVRRLGNLGLSFLAKASSGYWQLFDPTNGYTALHAQVAAHLPLEALSRRYFFETDLLFRLNVLRAVVVDVPMDALYADEKSNMRIGKVLFEFAAKHARNFTKRIAYSYFLRDLSVASLELLASLLLLLFSVGFGGYHWAKSVGEGVATPLGTIMVATVTFISGLQFALAFLGYDIASVPRRAVHPLLGQRDAIPREVSTVVR